MKKRLSESLEMHIVSTALNLDMVFENMSAQWRGLPYSELSTLLGFLMYMSHLHHTNHWIASGDPFYGDHQLFQRIYEAAQSEVDGLGEKVIGLGSISNVDILTLLGQVNKWATLSSSSSTSTIPSRSELAKKSLDAEMSFIKFCALSAEKLKETGLLTRGLDNLLAGYEDAHEGSVYLLKQRIMGS